MRSWVLVWVDLRPCLGVGAAALWSWELAPLQGGASVESEWCCCRVPLLCALRSAAGCFCVRLGAWVVAALGSLGGAV